MCRCIHRPLALVGLGACVVWLGLAGPTWGVPLPGDKGVPAAKLVSTFTGHAQSVYHVAFSPDGKYLATASKDKTLRVWDVSTGKVVHVLKGHAKVVYSSVYSPPGNLLASGSEDHTIKLWNASTGALTRTLNGQGEDIYHIAVSTDGKYLASGGYRGVVRIWDLNKGKVLHALKRHSGRVCSVCFSPDGRWMVSACGTSGTGSSAGGEVKMWDVASGREVWSWSAGAKVGVFHVIFTAEGKRLIGACLDGSIRVWERATLEECLHLKGHKSQAYCVALHPVGRYLASCGGYWSKATTDEVRLWDLASGKQVLHFSAHAKTVWSVAFSPDGQQLATCSGMFNKTAPGEAKLWQLTGLGGSSPVARPLTAPQLEALWADLAHADARRAYRAVWALRAVPTQAIALLARKASPPMKKAKAKSHQIDQLMRDLNADDFAVREKASEQLALLGMKAYPALEKALSSPSLEVRRRAQQLLNKLKKKTGTSALPPKERRAYRSIEVLQQIGTSAVYPVLEKWASGSSRSPITEDARIALTQLKRKAKR